MARVRGCFEVTHNTGARKPKPFQLPLPARLLRRLSFGSRFRLLLLSRFDLLFDSLAFPPSRHASILPQFSPLWGISPPICAKARRIDPGAVRRAFAHIGGEIPHNGENCGKMEAWREGGKARLSKSRSNRLSKRSLKRLPKDRRRSSRAGKGSWKGFGFRAPVLCVTSKQPRTRAIENS